MTLTKRKWLLSWLGCVAPLAPASHADYVTGLIIDASNRWGLDQDQMLRIAMCESHTGDDPHTYDGRSGYYGVYQFSMRTWAWASSAAGLAGQSPLSDFANVETAHWLMATVGPSQWSCK